MANHGHYTHALCLLTLMMSEGLCLSLRDPSLIWSVDQFDRRLSPDLTDSSTLQWCYSLVMSIPWNCDFLPRRRFVSGAIPCRRWIFRLSTGDCPLTQGYGGFTWVFDPGINRVLVEDEDVINLVETKQINQAQWVTSGDLESLFVFVADENYASNLSVSNRKTEKSTKLIRMIRREESYKTIGKLFLGLRLKGFLELIEFTQVCLVVIHMENLESQYSHAQSALALVFARSVAIEKGLRQGLHNGALVKAKLLVPSQFANSLIGNGNREAIIATGADVHIPVGDQILDCISENEVVIEIKGEYSHYGTTIPMARNLLGVFVKEATSTLVMFSSPAHDYIDRAHIDGMMEFWLYQSGFCWIELSNLLVGLVNYWRQDFAVYVSVKTSIQYMWRDFWNNVWVIAKDEERIRLWINKAYVLMISRRKTVSESSLTTFKFCLLIKVMPKAFWSFISKMIAIFKCVKEGHNRLFHLLAWQTSERIARLLSTLSSKLFQFPIFAYNGCFVLVLYFVNSF